MHPGELISLVGSSGTGKSTLLRIIAGLEDPTTGRVTYGGQPLERGSVGVVFQRPILYPHLSVRIMFSSPRVCMVFPVRPILTITASCWQP